MKLKTDEPVTVWQCLILLGFGMQDCPQSFISRSGETVTVIASTICAMELWASRCRLSDFILVIVIDRKIYIHQIILARDFLPILNLKESAFLLCSTAIPQASPLGRSLQCQCCSPQWKRGAILALLGDTCPHVE